MRSTHPPLKLSPEEETFLRHWFHDEVRYQEGQGPAKRLQVHHQVRPADLAVLIAAAMPDPAEQEQAARGPTTTSLTWPWPGDTFPARLAEARALLGLPQTVAQG